jgi:hypothetical protein
MSDEPIPRHEVAGWVRAQRLPPATKLVLMLAFDHAGPQEDGRWVAWVGNPKIAEEAGFAEGANGSRTVRRHLADMEEAGLIEREERTRANGSRTTNRIVFLVPSDPGVRGGRAPESGGPRTVESGPEAVGSKPNSKPHSSKERAREKAKQLPDDFPDALKPHARKVFAILRDVAEQHGAKEVTPRGVGLAIQGHPGRRFVATAYELASWAQNRRTIKDAVATYRTFLDRADVYAGVENFEAPVPIAAMNGNGNGSHLKIVNGRERVDWGAIGRELKAQGL